MATRPPLNDVYGHPQPVVILNWLNDPIPTIGTVTGDVSATIPPATKFADKAFDVVAATPAALDLSIMGVGEDVYYVNLRADIENTKAVYYSSRSNVSASGANRGFQLNPGDEKALPVNGGVNIYVIAEDTAQKAFYEVLNGG